MVTINFAPGNPLAGLLPAVQEFLQRSPAMLIGDEWVSAASGETFSTLDPASETELARVPLAGPEDVDLAVRSARQAFDGGSWGRLPAVSRARLLWRLAELIDEHADELAQLESLDNGKPISVSRNKDIPASAEMFRYMAGWATKLYGDTIPVGAPGLAHAYTRLEPVGVVGQIIPWNFPLLMASWKLAPALAAGCAVILKPAEQTPLTALRLGELFVEAGFPPGAVNVLTGFGEGAGAAVAAHPRIDKVAFTGSTATGRLIVAAALGNLKRVSLELGGKSAHVIFANADIAAASLDAAQGIFENSGQMCAAGSRLYVQQTAFDEVVAGLVDRAQRIKIGHGLDPATEMGPLVSLAQFDRVTDYICEGTGQGAVAATGGGRAGTVGYFVEPTVLTEVNPHMSVVREEIFGPVVTVSRFSDEADLIEQANDTVYGLAAGIWTQSLSQAHRVANELNAGTVWVNGYNKVGDPGLPFGGFKESGWGREKGYEGLRLYTETKTVIVSL